MERILEGIKVVNIGYNLPAPLAASKLVKLGAQVIKIEPPNGDPFHHFCSSWYKEMTINQKIITLDLKTNHGKKRLQAYLEDSDLFLTSSRPSSLIRLGVSWSDLCQILPNLCMISIVGYSFPDEDLPGHDLTYQAKAGLIDPPGLPKTLLADLLGAQRVVQAALKLLLYRFRTGENGLEVVTLSDVLSELKAPINYGLTIPHGPLGGKYPQYNIYKTKKGWIALATLEEKYWLGVQSALGILGQEITKETLDIIFLTRTAAEWKVWADVRKLPIAVIKT